MNGIKSLKNSWYFLISAAVLSGCSLSEVHEGQYCPRNTDGYYADDAYSIKQKDSTQSGEGASKGYCQSTFPECVEDVCVRCRDKEVWVETESDAGYSCLPVEELDDCDTESCEKAKERIAPICTSECSEGVFSRCLEYLTDAVKCGELGCNAAGTACAESPCGIGEVFGESECICDEKNHWIGNAGSCTCDKGFVNQNNECVEKQGCDAVKEVTNEDGSCSCNAEKHWVGTENNCKCDSSVNFTEVNGECVEKVQCDANKQEYSEKDNICLCNGTKHWVEKNGVCVCDEENQFVDLNGECVVKASCDPVREKYNGTKNECSCNTGAHWVGTVGRCTCDTEHGYTQYENSCVVKAICDENKEVYNSNANTCACDSGRHWTGTPHSCKCENGYAEVNKVCQIKPNCSGLGDHVVYQSSGNICGCDTKNGWAGTVGYCTCSAPGFAETTAGCKSYANLAVGDKVYFGHFEQDNIVNNGKEKIVWLVLKKENSKVLLLSEKGLDNIVYAANNQNLNWKDCFLRIWLNGDFMKDAFNEEETSKIQLTNVPDGIGPTGISGGANSMDYLYILSFNEIETLLPNQNDRILYATPVTVSHGAYIKDANNTITHQGECKQKCRGWWYSRTPGLDREHMYHFDFQGEWVTEGKGTSEEGYVYYAASVRPAMWVKF